VTEDRGGTSALTRRSAPRYVFVGLQRGSSALTTGPQSGGPTSSYRDRLEDTTERTWDRVVDVILKGCFLCCQAALPGMRRRGYGKIVNIASISGIIGGAVSRKSDRPRDTRGRTGPAYAAAKGGVIALTKWVAKDAGPDGIYVNAVAPGPIETEMTRGFSYPVDRLPIARMGTPEDIAEAVVFLASPASNYITGQVLCVDGGWVM
jgi:3-oxoacyl-[acyl-carrier protein] reductase